VNRQRGRIESRAVPTDPVRYIDLDTRSCFVLLIVHTFLLSGASTCRHSNLASHTWRNVPFHPVDSSTPAAGWRILSKAIRLAKTCTSRHCCFCSSIVGCLVGPLLVTEEPFYSRSQASGGCRAPRVLYRQDEHGYVHDDAHDKLSYQRHGRNVHAHFIRHSSV